MLGLLSGRAAIRVARIAPPAARLRRVDLSRRTLLRTGLLAAGVGTTYAALEGIGGLVGSASASRIATGSHKVAADADLQRCGSSTRSPSSAPTTASL